MESDQGKLFVGGISWETEENLLKEYFSNYGEVSHVTVMRDKLTARPRGFGFVSFSDPIVLDRVLQDKHHIDNRDVDVKRAMSREEQSNGSNSSIRSFDSNANNIRTKKIFVGGLPPTLSSEDFRAYFQKSGSVSDAVIMIDQTTQRPRGFGFVSFDSEDSVDLVLHKTFHDLNGKQVEVKRALPKDSSSPGVTSFGGGSSRYMPPPQNSGSGGYAPPYGGGFGYGSNGLGYGGFSGYGTNQATTTSYVNQGLGPRSSWGAQATSGYGNLGYGNASAPWGGSVGYGYGAVGGRPNAMDGLGGYVNHQGNNGHYAGGYRQQ